MANGKGEVITFKVDQSLLAAMGGIENRSEFIRAAVMNALDGACPLCKGTGRLTPNQKNHWNAFAADHVIEECGKCHEPRLVCAHERRKDPHARKAKQA